MTITKEDLVILALIVCEVFYLSVVIWQKLSSKLPFSIHFSQPKTKLYVLKINTPIRNTDKVNTVDYAFLAADCVTEIKKSSDETRLN